MQRYRWPGNVRELQNVVERPCCSANRTGGRRRLPTNLAASPDLRRPVAAAR